MGIDPDHLTSDHSARYLQYRARRQRLHKGDAAALRHLIDFLRLVGVVPTEEIPAGCKAAVEHHVLDYERFLRESRGLATATILNYLPFVRAFLQCRFGNGQVTLSSLRASDIVGLVRRQASGLQKKRAKLSQTSGKVHRGQRSLLLGPVSSRPSLRYAVDLSQETFIRYSLIIFL